MRTLLLCCLVVLCLSHNPAKAQDCSEYTDCDACTTNDPGCGWCSATQKCLSGNSTGPHSSLCIHSWEHGTCEECSKNTDCRSCHHFNNECFWCRSKSACLQIGFTGCKEDIADSSCPCEDYTSCSSCANVGCNFCEDSGICIDKSNTTFQCKRAEQCLCDANPNCGACLSDPTCGWCEDSRVCAHKVGGSCAMAQSCEFSCSRAAHSCGVCTKVAGCAWCAKTGSCMDINTNLQACDVTTECAEPPQVCPKKFDGGSFAGGMALIFGLGLFVAAGFVYYRKRQSSYAALN